MTAATRSQTMSDDVVDFLAHQQFVTISTSSFTGMPHADTVAFVNDRSRIYFHILDDTQIRNIRDNRHVSLAVDEYSAEWRKVRELRGAGPCTMAAPGEHHLAAELFVEKYGRPFQQARGPLYRLMPSQLEFVEFGDALHGTPRARTFHLDDA